MNARGRRNLRAFDVYLRPSEEVRVPLGAMRIKVHATVYWLLFNFLVIARCDHIQDNNKTVDVIDHSRSTAAGESITKQVKNQGIHKYWRWSYPKLNKPEIIDLPRTIAGKL